jgi:hypothetical protein
VGLVLRVRFDQEPAYAQWYDAPSSFFFFNPLPFQTSGLLLLLLPYGVIRQRFDDEETGRLVGNAYDLVILKVRYKNLSINLFSPVQAFVFNPSPPETRAQTTNLCQTWLTRTE